jgi:hypothetical protein
LGNCGVGGRVILKLRGYYRNWCKDVNWIHPADSFEKSVIKKRFSKRMKVLEHQNNYQLFKKCPLKLRELFIYLLSSVVD